MTKSTNQPSTKIASVMNQPEKTNQQILEEINQVLEEILARHGYNAENKSYGFSICLLTEKGMLTSMNGGIVPLAYIGKRLLQEPQVMKIIIE